MASPNYNPLELQMVEEKLDAIREHEFAKKTASDAILMSKGFNLAEKVERLEDKIEDAVNDKHSNNGGSGMDIASLMALVQSNKSMDLSQLAAMCKDKGGMAEGGGGFMWIILILLLLGRGGGILGGGDSAVACQAAAREGFDMNVITSLYDRNAAVLQAVNAGNAAAQTNLCEAIAQAIATTNNQADRLFTTIIGQSEITRGSVQSLSDRMSACCCAIENALTAVNCKLAGLATDIANSRDAVMSRISLSEERSNWQFEKVNNNIIQSEQRITCLIKDTAKDELIERQREQICTLKEDVSNKNIVDRAVRKIEGFAINHYTPTACGRGNS